MRGTRILVVLALMAVAVGSANGQIPKELSYQGVLTDSAGTPLPDGPYAMTFGLYDVASGGSALWEETKLVQVQGGIFSTYLGDTTPFPGGITWTSPYWLSIQVGADPALSPRVRLAAAPYSLNPAGGGSSWVADSATGFLMYDGGPVLIGRNFRVSGNEVFGVRAPTIANQYGGMYIETSDAAGWPFYGFATNGSFRSWTYYQPDSSGNTGPGWKLYLSGVRLTVPPTGGLRIGPSADYSLVIENTTGSDGIRVLDTGDDAIQIGSNPDVANYGVYIPSPGVSTYGLWPNTSNAAGEWALYTVDNLQAGNVFAGAYTLIAQVTGGEALTEGDLVAAVGLGAPVPGAQPSLSLVRLADEEQYTGIIGVVRSRMVVAVAPGKEAEGEMSMHSVPGPAQPGDYVALTIAGVANVKVAGGATIRAGERLTAGTAGRARPLRTRTVDGMIVAEGAAVVGVALGPSGDGATVPVHITIR
jgi:hypothetical protein